MLRINLAFAVNITQFFRIEIFYIRKFIDKTVYLQLWLRHTIRFLVKLVALFITVTENENPINTAYEQLKLVCFCCNQSPRLQSIRPVATVKD